MPQNFNTIEDLMPYMEEFPSNSQQPVDPRKKHRAPKNKKTEVAEPEKHNFENKDGERVVEAVVSEPVIMKKKPFTHKVKEVLFGGEAKSVGAHILSDVLFPALRNLMYEATTTGIERMIYGDTQERRPNSPRSRTPYNRPVQRYGDPRRGGLLPDQAPRSNRMQDVGDIVINSRQDAEMVIDRLQDLVEQYEVASFGDLKSLLNQPTNYTDQQWGWYELPFASVNQTREGYLLNLPPMQPI